MRGSLVERTHRLGPRHRLQTANRGVKGVHSLPNDHRLQRQRCSRFPEAFTLARRDTQSGTQD
eukprot:1182375-Prorocentrum_minimum.AAC.2